MPFPSLYFDESYAEKPLLTTLRNEGFDVKSFDETNMAEASDEEQLEFAVSEERVLFSFNREDFHKLHEEWLKQGREHWGILLGVQTKSKLKANIKKFKKFLNSYTKEQAKNTLFYF